MSSSISAFDPPAVAVVGGGPSGLMAADALSRAGVSVHLYDAMPSVGRKLLLAGKGGLNLTHGEELVTFGTRYGNRQAQVAPWLDAFGPAQVRAWAQELGVETFVGSSGRLFPRDLKAAPLLRAWLHRLRQAGVRFHMRHRWIGWLEAGAPGGPPGLRFQTPAGLGEVQPSDAVVLALGGASWPRLGSDGAWVPWLRERGVAVAALQAANCGFDVAHGPGSTTGWTAHLASRFAGAPLKNVALKIRHPDSGVTLFEQSGEAVVTQQGLEGGLVYAASATARELIAAQGHAVIHLNLLPQRTSAWVIEEVARPRGPRSLATHLKTRLGIDGVKAALVHEVLSREVIDDPSRLAAALQALPITLKAPRPIAEAISTAGGVSFDDINDEAMLSALPGVFVAGEMIDWEAPTGGYLLTACLASGLHAAQGVRQLLQASGA